MVYMTSDTHGDFSNIMYFSKIMQTTKRDLLIILGDAGVNYHLNERDEKKKRKLASLDLTILCIHGNHEQRPMAISTYKKRRWCDGIVYIEEAYPNILFARDGEIYKFGRFKVLVIGGAYSVDKPYRIRKGRPWFANEQPSEIIKRRVERRLQKSHWRVDVILSHTIPLKYEPKELSIVGDECDLVDKTTETWLDYIEDKTKYRKWFCGHYHIEKKIDKVQIVYDKIRRLKL